MAIQVNQSNHYDEKEIRIIRQENFGHSYGYGKIILKRFFSLKWKLIITQFAKHADKDLKCVALYTVNSE